MPGSIAFLDLRPGQPADRSRGASRIEGASTDLEVSILGEVILEPEIGFVECSGEPIDAPTRRPRGTDPDPVDDPADKGCRRPDGDPTAPPADRLATTGPGARDRINPAPNSKRDESPPNVIIYLVDALRSDRLGVYGCDRPLSPRLDALAATGIVFTDMVAQSSWTKAAVASIFTGLWPRAHGVNGPDDRLPEALPTLPELLQAAGYQTAAVVANAYVGRPFGFARGFDHFEFIEHTRDGRRCSTSGSRRGSRPATRTAARSSSMSTPSIPTLPTRRRRRFSRPSRRMSRILRSVRWRRFAVSSSERWSRPAELGRDLRELYDGEVAANDASFGRLLDELEAIGELDNTVVIFTSDHGEAFGEHGNWTHGLDLSNEVLSIPLVVRLPGASAAVSGCRHAGSAHRSPAHHSRVSAPSIHPRTAPGARLLDPIGDDPGGGGSDDLRLSRLLGKDRSCRSRLTVGSSSNRCRRTSDR